MPDHIRIATTTGPGLVHEIAPGYIRLARCGRQGDLLVGLTDDPVTCLRCLDPRRGAARRWPLRRPVPAATLPPGVGAVRADLNRPPASYTRSDAEPTFARVQAMILAMWAAAEGLRAARLRDLTRTDAAIAECEEANLDTPDGQPYPRPSAEVCKLLTELRRRRDPAARPAKPATTKRSLNELFELQEAILGGDREEHGLLCEECQVALPDGARGRCSDCRRRVAA